MKSLSRRDFLKVGGLALSSLAFTHLQPEWDNFEDIDLVRVAYHSVSVYQQPDDKSPIVRSWTRDDLIHVYDTIQAKTPVLNPVWYRVFGGYLHRARLQQVRFQYNSIPSSLPEAKVLAEVTVPYSQPYRYSQWEGWVPVYRIYYSTLHWIAGLEDGPDGQAWYKVLDEADKSQHYFVPASHLRLVAADEYSPLSPDVPSDDKYIDCNLQIQTLFCYENDREVYRADISSGLIGLYPTPTGRFSIQVKLPARDMHGSDRFASEEENVLSGVPWCSFFTTEGHAFHGTFWHDNFGQPMSHGCINMRNEDARWLFRWTTPKAGYDQINQQTLDVKGMGTTVIVHF